jgi:hypothetical protein
MARTRTLLPPLLALGLLACASETRSTATGLSYQDPAAAADAWRLVQAPDSTPQRLLLDLVGPAGLPTRGAGFNLRAPAAVRFRAFAETGFPVRDHGVWELLNSTPEGGVNDPLEPKLLAGGVKPGNLLTVGVFQKDRRVTAKASGQPLLQIALELDPAAGVAPGAALALAIEKARHIAEDIGPFNVEPTYAMAAKAHLVDMPIAVGTLVAR